MSKIQLHGNLTAAIYATTNKKLLNMRRHLSVGANFEIPHFNPLKPLKPLILPIKIKMMSKMQLHNDLTAVIYASTK